jgi:hypothetical protein
MFSPLTRYPVDINRIYNIYAIKALLVPITHNKARNHTHAKTKKVTQETLNLSPQTPP